MTGCFGKTTHDCHSDNEPVPPPISEEEASNNEWWEERIMREDMVLIDKETVLNVLAWDWNQLKEKPDSVDWIPALRALEKLEEIVTSNYLGGGR